MASKINQADFIDINSILNGYRKSWYWFVISIVFFGLLGYVFVKTHNTEYSVHANLLIDDDEANPLLSSMDLGGLFGSSTKVDDEVFVVSSHSLLRDVVKQLGINETHLIKEGLLEKSLAYPQYPVQIKNDNDVADTLTTTLMFKVSVDKKLNADVKVLAKGDKILQLKDVKLPADVKTPYGTFVLDTTQYYPAGESLSTVIYLSGYGASAEQLAKSIDIDLVNRKSNVIQMAIESENVAYGEDILNTLIMLYNRKGVSDKTQQGEKTLLFIDDRIRLLANDLDDAESAIQAYKQQHGIIDV